MQESETSAPGPEQAPDKPRVFYGWWLVLLAGLVVTVAAVPYFHATVIWVLALQGHFGWSLNRLSWALTLSRFFALLTPVVGYLTDWLGPRRLVLPGLCIVAAGFVVLGLIQNLPTFYASFTIIVIGVEGCGSIPLIVMLSRWFVRRRAFAIAIFVAIPALLALPLVPMLAWSVDAETAWAGWRLTAFIVVVIVALVAAVAFSRMRNSPGDMGLQPDGDPGLANQVRQTEFTLGQALRSRPFWYITAGNGLILASAQARYIALNWKGLDAGSLALMIAAAGLIAICFYLIGGLAGDRFTKHRVMALFAVVQALGILTLVFAGHQSVIALAIVLMSIGAGGLVPLLWAIIPDYFGTRSLGRILGVQGLIAGLVSGLAPASYLVGPVLDWTGSFILALLPSLVLTLVAAYLFLKSVPPQPTGLTSPQDEEDWANGQSGQESAPPEQ